MGDLISRQDAIVAIEQHKTAVLEGHKWDEGIEYGYAAAHRHIVDIVEQLPSVQPDTTTHDSIPAETGKNDGDRTSGDCISRTQAIDEIHEDADWLASQGSDWQVERMERDKSILMSLPSVQPEHKTGRWIPTYEDCCADVWVKWKCSECGYVRKKGWKQTYDGAKPDALFCEMCNADMRGEQDG